MPSIFVYFGSNLTPHIWHFHLSLSSIFFRLTGVYVVPERRHRLRMFWCHRRFFLALLLASSLDRAAHGSQYGEYFDGHSPHLAHFLGGAAHCWHTVRTHLSWRLVRRETPQPPHAVTIGQTSSPHDKNHPAMRPAISSGRWAAGSFLRRASKAHSREQYFVWHE